MAPLEDRIERARLEREAQERHAAARRTPGTTDPSFPPAPILGRPGDGNPHVNIEAAHKAALPVWGILCILAATAGVGYMAANAFGGVAKTATVDAIKLDVADMKKSQAVNQAVVETTLTNLRGDVQEIKDALRIAKQPEPLTPEKKPTERPHR